ncbi:WcaI family glycosyltransferase [Caulobacter sp. 1776]|uniref:WcaI family glycosyltransferase n=1 Tax=Caulobacter sp. 1776 TaxID=3156420 RepID=UPI0033976FED
MAKRSNGILVLGINYAPDLIGISKYTTELCEELVRRGYSVSVVTAPPYYPAWQVPAEYRKGWWTSDLNGVEVHRVPIFVPPNPTGLTRLLHLLSFSLASFLPCVSLAVRSRPQHVISVAPSLLSAPVALLAAKICGARTWLHIQDFEVDAAFELGMLQGAAPRRLALGLERAILRSFDRVSTISGNMLKLLSRKGVEPGAAIELRNWVDIDTIVPLPSSNTAFRKELGLAESDIVALYSGNMAAKQGLEVLAEVATLLEKETRSVKLILCGRGPLRNELFVRCKGLSNVHFLDLQPLERLSELLSTADIHLLPQRPEAADLVLPSKLTGMLASGRPIVAMANEGTALADEVDGCGVVVRPSDAADMVSAIKALSVDAALRSNLGKEARKRAESRWQKRNIIDRFVQDMSSSTAL